MSRCHGFSIVEGFLVGLLTILVIVICLPLVAPTVTCGPRAAACAANLSSLYKSFYTYSISDPSDRFPIAGTSDMQGKARGFMPTDRIANRAPDLTNNVTASLWIMIRNESASPRTFTCDSAAETPDPILDNDAKPAELSTTFDFASPDHLSYSPINMHGAGDQRDWGANVPADKVLMGDNNNAQGHGSIGGLHQTMNTSPPLELSPDALALNENSDNHSGGEGQHFLFGDGHAAFSTDPFQGDSGDNVMAADSATSVANPEVASRPFLDIDQGGKLRRDTMLLPLTGNGGGPGSLAPGD